MTHQFLQCAASSGLHARENSVTCKPRHTVQRQMLLKSWHFVDLLRRLWRCAYYYSQFKSLVLDRYLLMSCVCEGTKKAGTTGGARIKAQTQHYTHIASLTLASVVTLIYPASGPIVSHYLSGSEMGATMVK